MHIAPIFECNHLQETVGHDGISDDCRHKSHRDDTEIIVDCGHESLRETVDCRRICHRDRFATVDGNRRRRNESGNKGRAFK
jgi:hypothetical protein